MVKIAFFDTKSYDREEFEKAGCDEFFSVKFLEYKLNEDTVYMAKGCKVVCTFVNDNLNKYVINELANMGVELIALRCAGYNNVDFKAAYGKIHVVRVPAYSPYAVAEHAFALMLTLNRKTHKAFNRTRESNFNLSGLTGFDMNGKTLGVIGMGKIGKILSKIGYGFGMEILAYDKYPQDIEHVRYTELDELFEKSDIISLHCPLIESTHHMINKENISKMKNGIMLINTSRGGLVDTEALIEGIKELKIGAAGLDVYEEEANYFFEDFSNEIIEDDKLARLLSFSNVIITSHQAFLTEEALSNIAETTLENIKAYFADEPLKNEICYQCKLSNTCDKSHKKRCF